MVGPNTKIKAVDTISGKLYSCTISELFSEFADRAHYYTTWAGIDFTEIPMLIKGYAGWTRLEVIKKTLGVDPNKFVSISIPCSPECTKEIFVTDDELLPIYDYTNSRIGFHGERKFEYTLCNPERVPLMGTMRVDGEFNEDEEKMDFFTPTIRFCAGEGLTEGYSITTKCSFFSADGVTMYASDTIPVDAIKEWGWA